MDRSWVQDSPSPNAAYTSRATCHALSSSCPCIWHKCSKKCSFTSDPGLCIEWKLHQTTVGPLFHQNCLRPTTPKWTPKGSKRASLIMKNDFASGRNTSFGEACASKDHSQSTSMGDLSSPQPSLTGRVKWGQQRQDSPCTPLLPMTCQESFQLWKRPLSPQKIGLPSMTVKNCKKCTWLLWCKSRSKQRRSVKDYEPVSSGPSLQGHWDLSAWPTRIWNFCNIFPCQWPLSSTELRDPVPLARFGGYAANPHLGDPRCGSN